MTHRNENSAPALAAREALEQLIETHYEAWFSLAWRMTGSRSQAEDITQDGAVKIAQAIQSFRGDSALSTWAYTIIYRTALDHLRARSKIVPMEPEKLTILSEAAQQDERLDALESAELWRAVKKLPDQQRDAVILVYAQDFSHAEAAKIMQCAESTVSFHLHVARKTLKTFLTADSP